MKRVLWLLQAVVFYLATIFFAILPGGSVRLVGRLIGRMLAVLIPMRRRIAVENIRLSLPDMVNSPEWSCKLGTAEELSLIHI